VVDEKSGHRRLKRAAALVPLSRDHHFALIHALGLRRAAAAPAASSPGVVSTAEAFLAFYEQELLGHFRDEEDVLLPVADRLDPKDAARTRAEHDDLRELTAALRQAVSEGGDLRPAMQAVGDRLHDHVRFEERVLFENVQSRLPSADLDDMGRALEAHRVARGRAASCLVLPPALYFKR
jgi:hypothetical protein